MKRQYPKEVLPFHGLTHNTVYRVSTNYELNCEKLLASVTIPHINTVIDLLNIQPLPYFRIIVSLGTTSDMVFNEMLKDYVPAAGALHGVAAVPTAYGFQPKALLMNKS
jgi:hypothetical protein